MDDWMYAPSSGGAATLDASAASAETSHGFSAFRGSNSQDPSKGNQHRIRRRNRVIASCLECRRRKLKCDKTAPCTNCVRFKRDCLYLAPASNPHSQQKLAEIKERMGALEKTLEEEVAGQNAKAHMGGANVTRAAGDTAGLHVVGDDEDDSGAEDEDVLEPTPLAALDNVYEDNADDELMDLGVQMGRMRISERIGGWIRPKLVEELNDTLEDVKSGKATFPLAHDRTESMSDGSQAKLLASPKSYIGPGPDYIAPASSFFFPGTNMNTSLIDYLPSKVAADQLVAQYFHAVHAIARAVHRPTFESQYALFWAQIAAGTEPVPSQQAVVFAVIFSAAVSMSEEQIAQQFGTTRATLVDSLRTGTEMTLSRANFLRTTKLGTMQAFVIYLIPLIRAEVSRAHSALVGTAIRLAECMGLHRDGTYYNMTPVETHVRRMLWHQLCFLDMRTCDATGPRPQIRPDDYDTKYPLNVDDVDLLQTVPPTEDKPHWTDMTLFRIRCELFQLRRTLWFDIVQIDKKKKSLTSVLVKVQKIRSRVKEQYLPIIDERVPVQMVAKHAMDIGLNGCFIQVLHRYLFSTTQRMPDRLRQLLIEAGVANLEASIALETEPELRTWAWYKGALNQYHAALLLMVEVYAYPMRKDAARIWRCLDFIFDIPSHLSPKQKAELVITDLRDRMEIYHQMRKIKNTTHLEERVQQLTGSAHRDSTSPSLSSFADVPRAGNKPNVVLPTSVPINAMLPASFSPPPAVPTESSGSDSRHGSVPLGGGDVQMATMDDIDWAEWDKYFPIEQNTGDLNIPNFNFADFTGMGSAPYDSNLGAGTNLPTAHDLADITFTPTTFFESDMTRMYSR